MQRDTRLSDVLHVLLHMSQTVVPLTSEVLARSMGTNPAVFRRTMAGLRDAGIVVSGKGHGGGWRLAQPLREITLLAVYEALGRPKLFAFGNRSRRTECLVERGVNALLETTITDATALLTLRFNEITLDQIVPDAPVSLAVHDASG